MTTIAITDRNLVTSKEKKLVSNPTTEVEYWSTQQAPGGTDSIRYTIPQSTTVSRQTGGSFVSDVDVAAYMRGIDINIVAHNLRPNRRVYVFFDGKDVTKLFQQPNVLICDRFLPPPPVTTNNVIDKRTTEDLRIEEGNAKILYAERKGDLYYMYIGEIFGANNSVDSANASLVVINTKTGQRANVISQKHASGVLTAAKKYLKTKPSGMTAAEWQKEMSEKRYWNIQGVNLNKSNGANLVGQTITILNGPNPGQTTQIVSYNIANGEIYLSKGLPELTAVPNLVYSIGNVDPTANANNTVVVNGQQVFYDSGAPDVIASRKRLSSGNLYTNDSGSLIGKLRIPEPIVSSDYRFKVGEKLLRITDSPTNDPEEATTIAEYIFVAGGLKLSTSQIVVDNVTAKKPTGGLESKEKLPVDEKTLTISTRKETKTNKKNPIAQSFFVDSNEYPQGFYTPFVDLFFANKGTLPVEVQIRPMINGFPSSKDIIPNAVSIKMASDVNVSERPDPNDANTYTRFEFVSPIHLQPDVEYALLVLTNDFDYDIYVSELGEKVIGTNRIVSEQPYLGSLFKSQNATTYTPIQSEDLMFVIHKCQFATSGSIMFNERKDITLSKPTWAFDYDANTRVDSFEVHSDAVELPSTKLLYSYRATNASNENLDNTYTTFTPERRTFVNQRKIVYSDFIPDNSFYMKVDFSTLSPDISPVIYTNKQALSAVETLINNMSLDPSRVVVANTGNGYTRQNTSITITSNTGQGANAVILTQYDDYQTGKIETLLFDSQGFGYYDDVNVTISTTDANASGAIIEILSETGKSGGPALARYISKTVTLAPEFDAGDLRVYVTAIKPREAEINIYYKVKNNFDNETIDDKKWVRMLQVPGAIEFTESLEAIEYEFRPSLTSNTIVYSTDNATFDTFNQYKIKIVMSSTDTVLQKVPFIYDMRAIALPGDD